MSTSLNTYDFIVVGAGTAGSVIAARLAEDNIATLLHESSTSSGNLRATHPLNGHRVAQMIPRLLPSACMSASNTFDAILVGAGRNALIAASYRSAKGRGGCLLDRSRTPGGWGEEAGALRQIRCAGTLRYQVRNNAVLQRIWSVLA